MESQVFLSKVNRIFTPWNNERNIVECDDGLACRLTYFGLFYNLLVQCLSNICHLSVFYGFATLLICFYFALSRFNKKPHLAQHVFISLCIISINLNYHNIFLHSRIVDFFEWDLEQILGNSSVVDLHRQVVRVELDISPVQSPNT